MLISLLGNKQLASATFPKHSIEILLCGVRDMLEPLRPSITHSLDPTNPSDRRCNIADRIKQFQVGSRRLQVEFTLSRNRSDPTSCGFSKHPFIPNADGPPSPTKAILTYRGFFTQNKPQLTDSPTCIIQPGAPLSDTTAYPLERCINEKGISPSFWL